MFVIATLFFNVSDVASCSVVDIVIAFTRKTRARLLSVQAEIFLLNIVDI